MTLLAPTALLLAVVGIPVVLMYVLRLRRPPRPVSSTFLWRRIIDDMQANAPWQRLRPSVLLALQVVALLGLVLALAGPAYSRSATNGADLIVILDQSSSMQAHDVVPSRFAAAQARAGALAGQMGSGRVISVIGMGNQPHLALVDSNSRQAVEQAIGGLHPTASSPNVLASLSLARSLARQGQDTRLVIFTDHSSSITALPMAVPFPVDIVRLGGRMRDLGITSFVALPGKYTRAVLRLHNFGRDTATSDLNLYADGQLADVRPVQLAPGASVSEVWDRLPAGIGQLRAHLTRRDDMVPDKTAWAVVRTALPRRVLLVTEGNYFLQTALSLDPSVQLDTESPEEYQPSTASADVIVFDGFLPPSLPDAAVLLVGPPRGQTAGIRFGGMSAAAQVSSSPVLSGDTPASVVRYVDLSDVHLARTRSVSLPDWLHPAAVSGTMPVIATGQSSTSRLGLIGFRLQDSDWPLRVSFPVVIQNLLSYLAPGTALGASTINPGQPLPLFPPPGTQHIDITKPDGSVEMVGPPFAPFADTYLPGIYHVRSVPAQGVGASFAVNSFIPRKPDEPGPSILHLGQRTPTKPHSVSTLQDLAWALGIVVVVLLSAEWWVAFRG